MSNSHFGYWNDSTFAALQAAQNRYNNDPSVVALRQLQRELEVMREIPDGVYAAVAEYQRIVAPLRAEISKLNNLYEPILMVSRCFESVYNDATVAALKSSDLAMKAALGVNFSEITNIAQALAQYNNLSQNILENINFEEAAKLYEDGTISKEDIAEEFKDIVKTKKFSLVETWNNIKKAKWFLALRIILLILTFLGDPVIEKVKDATFDALGVYEFWEESGIYEKIDEFFNIESDSNDITTIPEE